MIHYSLHEYRERNSLNEIQEQYSSRTSLNLNFCLRDLMSSDPLIFVKKSIKIIFQ
jgi:hypothetical protein